MSNTELTTKVFNRLSSIPECPSIDEIDIACAEIIDLIRADLKREVFEAVNSILPKKWNSPEQEEIRSPKG
jgi:hypothetical protein